MNDQRVIFFLILFFFFLRGKKENFDVQPVTTGGTIEKNRSVAEFFGKDIFKYDKDENYQVDELYDILDEVNKNISKTENIFDYYDKEYCPEGGNCITCRAPEVPEYAEIDEGCEDESPLDNICKFRCKENSVEVPSSNKTGVCSIQSPNPSDTLNELFFGEYEGEFRGQYIQCNPKCPPLTNDKLQEISGNQWARIDDDCDVWAISSPSPSECTPYCATQIIGSPQIYECKLNGEWGPKNNHLQCEDPCELPQSIFNKYSNSVDFSGCENRGDYTGGKCKIQCKTPGFYPYNGDRQDQEYDLQCDDMSIDSSPPAFHWNYPPSSLDEVNYSLINSVYNGSLQSATQADDATDFYLCNSPCPHSFDMDNLYSPKYSPENLTFECSSPLHETPEKTCEFVIGSHNNQKYYFRREDKNYNENNIKCEGNSGSPNAEWSSPQKRDMIDNVRRVCETDVTINQIELSSPDNQGPSNILSSPLVYVNCLPNTENNSNNIPSPNNDQICYFTLPSPLQQDYYFYYDGEAHTRLPLVCDSSPGKSEEWRFDEGDLGIYRYCNKPSPTDEQIYQKGGESGLYEGSPPEGKFVTDSNFQYDCKDGGKDGYYLKNRKEVFPASPRYQNIREVNYICNPNGSFTFKSKDGDGINWTDQFQCEPYCTIRTNENWWQSPGSSDIDDFFCGEFSFNGQENCKLSCKTGKIPTHDSDKNSYVTQPCNLNEGDNKKHNSYSLDRTLVKKWNDPPLSCEYEEWKNSYINFYIYSVAFLLLPSVIGSIYIYKNPNYSNKIIVFVGCVVAFHFIIGTVVILIYKGETDTRDLDDIDHSDTPMDSFINVLGIFGVFSLLISGFIWLKGDHGGAAGAAGGFMNPLAPAAPAAPAGPGGLANIPARVAVAPFLIGLILVAIWVIDLVSSDSGQAQPDIPNTPNTPETHIRPVEPMTCADGAHCPGQQQCIDGDCKLPSASMGDCGKTCPPDKGACTQINPSDPSSEYYCDCVGGWTGTDCQNSPSPPSPPPPSPEPSDKTLQFINKSGKDIWIIFTLTPDSRSELTDWTFYNGETISTERKYRANETMIYFGPISNNTIFSVDYNDKVNNKPVWISGKCSILPIEPPENIDVAGLTSLEWTFNQTGNLNPDISGLEGNNIMVEMELKDNSTCQPLGSAEYKRKCMININNPNYDQFRRSKIPGIPSLMRKDLTPEERITTEKYRGTDGVGGSPSQCGVEEDQDCIKCATGNDLCSCPNGPPCQWDPDYEKKGLRSECYYRSNKTKWGCYKWWSDPENKLAKDWLDLFNEDCPNTYRWVYDETKIQNYDPTRDKNKELWDETGLWENSIAYKCSQSLLPGPECNGYIVKNQSEVNINCGETTKDTKLIFTIHDILN